MTEEQKLEIKKIGKRLQLIFPDFFGNMKFNLATGKRVNINIVEEIDGGITATENLKL